MVKTYKHVHFNACDCHAIARNDMAELDTKKRIPCRHPLYNKVHLSTPHPIRN
jgi:hypothetical protein